MDSSGNLFVGDTFNHRIRKISPNGSVSTLAGNGMPAWVDGHGTDASFNFPEGVSVGENGYVFVADNYNHRIRIISPGGEVRTLAGCGTGSFADGFGTYACFYAPYDVAVDVNDTVYVADNWNHRICKITADGLVSTLAGSGRIGFADGQGTLSSFRYPGTVAVDHFGTVYVADTSCCAVSNVASNAFSSIGTSTSSTERVHVSAMIRTAMVV
jgi:sugar lactone lactonase YvrE